MVILAQTAAPGSYLVWAAIITALASLVALIIAQVVAIGMKIWDEYQKKKSAIRERLIGAYGESAYHLRKVIALATLKRKNILPHHIAEAQRHLLLLSALQDDEGLRTVCCEQIRKLHRSVDDLTCEDPVSIAREASQAIEFLDKLLLHDSRLTNRPGPRPKT